MGEGRGVVVGVEGVGGVGVVEVGGVVEVVVG